LQHKLRTYIINLCGAGKYLAPLLNKSGNMEAYTLDNIHTLLFREELLIQDDLVLGDYDVTTINRRNRNLQITTGKDRNYLVKQLQHKESESARTLKNELLFYKHVASDMPHIHSLFPQVKYADEDNVILILDFYKNASPLWKYYKERCPDDFPLQTAAATGRLLASFHQAFRDISKDKLPFLNEELPFVFHLHRPHPRVLATYGQGGYELLSTIQQDEALTRQWEAAKQSWEVNSLIHGDIKLDNIIVLPDNENGDSSNVKLVDWEMLQYGDLAFDIAGAFQDYIFLWLIMTPDGESAEEMIKKVPFPFSTFHPALNTYWEAYSSASALSNEAAATLLSRSVLFAGLRCLQTSFEISNKFDHIPAIAMILFNLGSSIIKDPEKAGAMLFGFKPSQS
jgi:aminoglycoside phosphotransferase (APT) family kinase protein